MAGGRGSASPSPAGDGSATALAGAVSRLALPRVGAEAAGPTAQPCMRCGAVLNVAAFAAGARVRCEACRAVNVTGAQLPARRGTERESARASADGSTEGISRESRRAAGAEEEDEPLERIFRGVGESGLMESAADPDRGPGSETVDVRLLEKFQPALAGLAPTGAAVGEGEAPPASRWSDQLEECQLGAYKILKRIATGGMGTVYEAEHIALHRKVAVKILHRDIVGSAEIQERVQREALTLARIRHPHIVEIFDIGAFEGRPFLVMEYIAGGDLKSLLAARPMEEREALRIAAEIAEAVDYAHQRGIIHRDLKPANILLDEAQAVKAADFGLAKVIGSSTQLTATGTTVGTPAYMAPEQARGQADLLDARADVYSIGAILYEMLTGRAPFSGAHLMDVLYKVVHEIPPHPQKVNGKVSADAATICVKAMAQRPEERYASAWALMGDLEALLHGESITARPPSPVTLLYRNMRKYAAIWAMALVLALGVGFEAGRYILTAYRNHTAEQQVEAIRTELLQPATDANGQPISRLDRYRGAIGQLERLYRKTGLRDADLYRQALERELQQWLTVERLRKDLAVAEAAMSAGNYKDAEFQLRLIAEADGGEGTAEATGEIQSLQTAARLRGAQLVDLRETRELQGLQAKYNEAQHKIAAGDFGGAEDGLRDLLIQLPADPGIYASVQVRSAVVNLRQQATADLKKASKHREAQMAQKLQKDLATQLDAFKGIPGIADVLTSWLAGENPEGGMQAEARPLPDPALATPPGVEPPAGLAGPTATPPTRPAGLNQPPTVGDLIRVIVPDVTGPQKAPEKKPEPAPEGQNAEKR